MAWLVEAFLVDFNYYYQTQEGWNPDHTATEALHPQEVLGNDIKQNEQGFWDVYVAIQCFHFSVFMCVLCVYVCVHVCCMCCMCVCCVCMCMCVCCACVLYVHVCVCVLYVRFVVHVCIAHSCQEGSLKVCAGMLTHRIVCFGYVVIEDPLPGR